MNDTTKMTRDDLIVLNTALLRMEVESRMEYDERRWHTDVVDDRVFAKTISTREELLRRAEFDARAEDFDDEAECRFVDVELVIAKAVERLRYAYLARARRKVVPMSYYVGGSLGEWARRQLKRSRGTPTAAEVVLFVYLTLRSSLEWDAAHTDEFLGNEDRFADEIAELFGEYDGSPDPFAVYATSLSESLEVMEGDDRLRVVSEVPAATQAA